MSEFHGTVANVHEDISLKITNSTPQKCKRRPSSSFFFFSIYDQGDAAMQTSSLPPHEYRYSGGSSS